MHPTKITRQVDPGVGHHRARIAVLRRHGHHAEADDAARDMRARQLLLATQRTVAAEPGLTVEQIEEIAAALRGNTAA